MKSMILLPMAVVFAFTGCASERLQVTVVDNMGNPVSNATVSVGFSTSHVLFGGDPSSQRCQRLGQGPVLERHAEDLASSTARRVLCEWRHTLHGRIFHVVV